MEKKNKITIWVLAIIVVILSLAGLVRCSVQGVPTEPSPAPMLEMENPAPVDLMPVPTPIPVNPDPVQPPQPPATSGKPPAKPMTPPENPLEAKPVEKLSPPYSGDLDDGDSWYPAATMEIILPEYSHADTEFEVQTVLRNVKSLEWSIAKEGEAPPQADYLKGTLDKNGGKITITRPGSYTITATAKNFGNQPYIFSKTIVIHPTWEIQVEANKTTHTDTTVVVTTTLSEEVNQQLNWHIYRDGQEIKWQDAVTGTLSNAGGPIRIKEKGQYTLMAVAFDGTSRKFSGKANITVYPVIEVTVQSPETAHTDTPFAVTANTKELGDLSLIWSATKDGKVVPLAEGVEGVLNNSGGTIRCLNKGTYTFTASVTDKAGRSFTAKTGVGVYPVAEFSFTLPATTHTDQAIKLSVQSAELQDMIAVWTVIKGGDPVSVASVISGNLSNTGGTIRFTQKGSYILKATLTDPTGREYIHTSSTVVYPVAEAGFYMPEMSHPDTAVEVETSFKETHNLTAVWSLTKDGKAIALTDGFEGELTNSGGAIRFRDIGGYELTATVTDTTGRSFSYAASVKVLPVIKVSLTLPRQTHTDRPVTASTELENAGTLPVVWSIVKNDIPFTLENTLTDEGGSIHFTTKGKYTVTACITDESGRAFSAVKSIQIYPIPNIAFSLPEAVHTDSMVTVDTVLTNMEGLTAAWYVDNTYGFQDWDTYIEGRLQNHGGSIHFTRAGVYDLQARMIDATGRVFFFNSGKIEVLPVLTLSFALPDTGHTDTQIDVRTRGNIGALPIEWTMMMNGQTVPLEQMVSGSLNAQGGKIRFLSSGEYRLTATMFDSLGRVFSASEKISIYPLYNCSFTMPSSIHTGREFLVVLGSGANLGNKSIVWTLKRNNQAVALTEHFKGSLTNNGGTVHVDSPGSYQLTASITDELDRVFSHSQTIEVINTSPTTPMLTANVTRIYANGKFRVPLSVNSIDPDGDAISYEYQGKASDDYYALGTHTVRVRARDDYGGESDWAETTFNVVNSAPTKPTLTANVTRTYANGKFLVNMVRGDSTDPDGDAVTYEYQGKTDDDYYALGSYTVKVRAKDSYGGISDWTSVSFTIANAAPTKPVVTANVNRNQHKDGKIFAGLTVNSTDPDGDTISYEYQNKAADNYYPIGTHTVQVRAKDNYGGISAWASVTFTVANSAPTRPEITRTPGGNSVVPGTPVTIRASSTDPDGDPITYIWEGRGAETSTYPMGKNTVRVKAVDSHGAESPWAAIVFFVMDNNGSGGMMLTGPSSTINENGIEGATITRYTFTVPPVSGHNGNDYGRVRGYNIQTGQWDQLDYGTTNNGISFTRELPPGIYSKLEMYYYTNHDCMYNKSNITYTVNYYFE